MILISIDYVYERDIKNPDEIQKHRKNDFFLKFPQKNNHAQCH